LLAAARAAEAAPAPAPAPEDLERFAHLQDQSGTVAPISNEERAARRQRLGRILGAQGFDAILMEGGATMSYLSDMSWGHSERMFGLVVLADGSHFWICPGFEAERARLRIQADGGPGGEIVEWQEHEYPFAPLAAALRERGAERLAIEPSLRHRFAHGMAQALGSDKVDIGLDAVVELRGRKDAHELAILRRAQELTQQAIAAMAEQLEPGMTGDRISRLMSAAYRRLGLSGGWTLTLIGPAAAYPHGGELSRPLERGSVLLVDTGAALHGYQSDCTRSWVFDAPVPAEVEKVWHTVKAAQEAAFAAIRPGRECRTVDQAARRVIEAAGYGGGYETFTHRLGHGIGMEGHEDPFFDGGSRVILKEGMTFSDEPGIYLSGRFGVRIEDVVAVTADGADHFGEWQAAPTAPTGSPR
ncbi:MAG: aminopeptidase P family protein, partial [Planctomycetota bacterium]